MPVRRRDDDDQPRRQSARVAEKRLQDAEDEEEEDDNDELSGEEEYPESVEPGDGAEGWDDEVPESSFEIGDVFIHQKPTPLGQVPQFSYVCVVSIDDNSVVVEDLGENVSLVGVLEFEFLLSAVKGAACRSAVTGAVCVVSLGIIFSATIIIRFAAGHVQLRCTFNSGVVGTVQRVVLKFIVRVSGCAARPGCVGF